jgi:hypothetical protein
MMAVLFAKGYISGGGIRPSFIYCMVMMMYPMVTLLIEALHLHILYPWVPVYKDADYVRFCEVSLAAIVPLYVVAFFSSKRLYPLESIQVRSIGLNGFEKRFLTFAFLVYFAYVATHLGEIFGASYREFQVSGGMKALAAMDYLVFFALLLRLPLISHDFSKFEKSMLLIYFAVKLFTGGRMFMVTIGLALLLFYIAKNRPSAKRVRGLLRLSPLVVLLMGLAVYFREKNANLLMMGYSLSQEYVNSTMGALKVAQLSLSSEREQHLDMLLDPLLSMIPSTIYERSNFAYFAYIDEKFGGWQNYNPIGGSYLPNEVFLVYPNLSFVFVYFALMAVTLYFLEKQLFSVKVIKMTSLGLSIRIAMLSIFLVFSVRHYFYVHIKHIFICLSYTSIFYVVSVLYTAFLKLSLRGNAKLKVETTRLVVAKN